MRIIRAYKIKTEELLFINHILLKILTALIEFKIYKSMNFKFFIIGAISKWKSPLLFPLSQE